MAMSMLEEILLCGVTAELFDRGPPEVPFGPAATPFKPVAMPFGAGVDGPALSERCESAIPVNLRLQFWIIADAGLDPGFTKFVCESEENFSSAELKGPGNFGGAGGGSAEGDIGLVDNLGMGGGGREKSSEDRKSVV